MDKAAAAIIDELKKSSKKVGEKSRSTGCDTLQILMKISAHLSQKLWKKSVKMVLLRLKKLKVSMMS